MGTMPPPALLPVIRLIDPQPAVHPVDPSHRYCQQPVGWILNPSYSQHHCQHPARWFLSLNRSLPLSQPCSPSHSQLHPSIWQHWTQPTQPRQPRSWCQRAYIWGMGLCQRLLSKILNLEFVEMQDLLPEAWLTSMEDDAAKCCSTSDLCCGGLGRGALLHARRAGGPWMVLVAPGALMSKFASLIMTTRASIRVE